ncbi:hypothetical protein KAS79_01205 [Candidatus Parcubacteria bacterium]|nr:hypothetical protein [Candidatus Parcubacteria bacterium]
MINIELHGRDENKMKVIDKIVDIVEIVLGLGMLFTGGYAAIFLYPTAGLTSETIPSLAIAGGLPIGLGFFLFLDGIDFWNR